MYTHTLRFHYYVLQVGFSPEDDSNGYSLMEADGYPKVRPLREKNRAGKCDDYDYSEPYFEPANKEEELIMQLSTQLVVPEISRENLK